MKIETHEWMYIPPIGKLMVLGWWEDRLKIIVIYSKEKKNEGEQVKKKKRAECVFKIYLPSTRM